MASRAGSSSNNEGGETEEEAPAGLNLDKHGRTVIDGTVCFDPQSYPQALQIPSEAALLQLVADCEAAFTARSIETPTASYSSGATFFLPACGKPRCKLEELARSIFDYHTRDVKSYDPSCSGAEWWTLVLDVDASDDVAFHWDRDYGLEEAAEFKLHPHVATVTYLTDEGVPTLILDKEARATLHHTEDNEDEEESVEEPIGSGWLSFPRRGKHISFDGKLLHGAPSEFASFVSPKVTNEPTAGASSKQKRPRSKKRVTFLVNIWLNHAPLESEPYPEEALSQLSSTSTAAEGSTAATKETARKTVQFVAGEKESISTLAFAPAEVERKTFKYTFVEMGQQMMHLQLDLVPDAIRKAVDSGTRFLHLEFQDGEPLGSLKAGEFIGGDSEGEESDDEEESYSEGLDSEEDEDEEEDEE